MARNLPSRTGKTLEQWVGIVEAQQKRPSWLDYDPEALVEALFSGKKEA